MKIAMWSGPRNISTAMMRSWDSRGDTRVIDEPFYAHYLNETGIDHPGAADIIKSQSVDWNAIVEEITAPLPDSHSICYQKHITTHMLPNISIEWIREIRNCFLIREPESVVASYSKQRESTATEDLGYRRQYQLFEFVRKNIDAEPVVIDSARFLENPEDQLRKICTKLHIDFQPAMLSWEPGIRSSDGIWHRHWYEAVASSTGFRPYTPKNLPLNDDQIKIAAECRQYYDALSPFAL